MAKEKTAAAETTSVVTSENVIEVRKAQNMAEISLGEEVDAEIKKEQDERKKREIKSRYLKAQYKIDQALVEERHSKRVLEINKFCIAQIGRIARFLKGFEVTEAVLTHAKPEDTILKRETVDEKAKTITIVTDTKSGKKETFKLGDKVKGIITIVEYDEALDTIENEKRKKMQAEENQRCAETREIDAAYGEYFQYSWRYRY